MDLKSIYRLEFIELEEQLNKYLFSAFYADEEYSKGDWGVASQIGGEPRSEGRTWFKKDVGLTPWLNG